MVRQFHLISNTIKIMVGLLMREEFIFYFKSKGRKKQYTSAERQSYKRKLLLTCERVSLFVTFRPNDWVRPTHIGENNLLYSTDSNIDLIHKHLHRHTLKNV